MKIFLSGFMGSGKSNIGRRVAKKLGCPFHDMDRYIESKEGMAITEIFAQKGEAYFRSLETAVIPEFLEEEAVVVACGGGIIMNPDNVDAIHAGGGIICFIDVPVAALQERLKADKRRPLLQRPDRREFIAALHAERLPKYLATADKVIDGAGPPVVIAERLMEGLGVKS